jgi:hypothetical protein
LDLAQMGFESIGPGGPDPAVPIDPVDRGVERLGLQAARSPSTPSLAADPATA